MTVLEFLQKNQEYLYGLRDRWSDEAEYEDFDAYRDAIRKCLPEGWTLTKATSRPFEFEVTTPECKGRVRVNAGGIRHWVAKHKEVTP